MSMRVCYLHCHEAGLSCQEDCARILTRMRSSVYSVYGYENDARHDTETKARVCSSWMREAMCIGLLRI
jgi:hypothetical protein